MVKTLAYKICMLWIRYLINYRLLNGEAPPSIRPDAFILPLLPFLPLTSSSTVYLQNGSLPPNQPYKE